MKPKEVICPICGEKMIAESWGMKRKIYLVLGDIRAPGVIINYVTYTCPCGCEVNYQGTKSCWKEE